MWTLILILIWMLLGTAVCAIWSSNMRTVGWELCNPYWAYQYHHVNWFGAIILSLLYTAFCPIGAVGYWFYKLCTVGRR